MKLLTGRSLHIPNLDLYLNIALDGYGETHDQIRGVPGNWEKALDCIRVALPAQSEILGSLPAQCEHGCLR